MGDTDLFFLEGAAKSFDRTGEVDGFRSSLTSSPGDHTF